MPRPALFAVLCLYCLLLALPARATLDDQQRALQQLQVQACRAVGSLLLLRGEGFQEQHAAQDDVGVLCFFFHLVVDAFVQTHKALVFVLA